MELHLNIIGTLMIGLSLSHVIFPSYFRWKEDLSSVSLINKEMMYVHTLFVAFTVFLMGLLCLTSSEELLHTILGKKVALGFGLFWLLRLLIQFFGYSPSLWKGKKKETTIHILFSILWTYFVVIFYLICFYNY